MTKRPFACNDGAPLLRKLPKNVSFSDFVALQSAETPADYARMLLREEVKGALMKQSVCGTILATTQLQLTDGTSFDWTYLRPAALLQELCRLNKGFGELVKTLPKPLRVAVYEDELRLGNVLRPDPNRAVACLYWCLMDMPSWVLSREAGWHHFAGFPCTHVAKLRAGYSTLFGRMLELFETDMGYFTLFGSGVPCQALSGSFVAQGTFSVLLSDEKAIKEMWGLKGASGTKPCVFCKNILGHMAPGLLQGHNYLLHYSSTSKDRFDLHTPISFKIMVKKLQDAKDTPGQLKKLCQLYGLSFNEDAVLWHPTWGGRLSPPTQTMFDWMHILCASGGLAQYEINEFLKLVKDAGVSMDQVDHFCSAVSLPKRLPRLGKNFFRDRLNTEPNSCLKSFSGEILVALPVLRVFIDAVLLPARVLGEHCKCLVHLANILNILQVDATSQLAALRAEVEAHQQLFSRLYPDCVKPKFHWLYHVPDSDCERT